MWKKDETRYKCLSTYSELFLREKHAHMSRDYWRQHFLGKICFSPKPKVLYILLERYFRADSKKVLPYIKKIILSKVTAILRPHDDIIIFLGKKYFSRISPLEIHYFFFLILYYQIVFVSGIICYVKTNSLVECGMLMILL